MELAQVSRVAASLVPGEITAADLPEAAVFTAEQSLSSTLLPVESIVERLRWFLLENPAHEKNVPLGWCLRKPSGELAAFLFCAPQKFRFGDRIFTMMLASSMYVDSKLRGQGLGTSLFQRYLDLGRAYPLFSSSANPETARMYQKKGAYPIGNSDHEMMVVLRWRPLVEEVLVRTVGTNAAARTAVPLLSPLFNVFRRLRLRPRSGELQVLNSPEEAANLVMEIESRASIGRSLTALRDAAYLRWRYFAPSDPGTRLFAFQPRGSEPSSLVAVNQQCRGHRNQIVALQVLDIYPEAQANLYPHIAAHLLRHYRGKTDAIVFRCSAPASQQALKHVGFSRHPLAAPRAWCLDPSGFLPSHALYLSPADGDANLLRPHPGFAPVRRWGPVGI